MNNVENHKKNKEIATLGITLALVVVLQALAEIIQKFGLPISFALGLIPVFVCGQVYGVKFGAISGGVFGLVSLFIALIYSGSIPMYAVAINPLVSVLPRILCGTVCALVYKGLSKAAAKSTKPRTEKQKRAVNFAIRLDGKCIGEVLLYRFDGKGGAEEGCRIAPEYAGHGYGAEAFAAAADWALYHLGLARVVAKCFKENEPSRKMLASCMRPSGEDETYFHFEKTV